LSEQVFEDGHNKCTLLSVSPSWFSKSCSLLNEWFWN